MKEVTRSGYLSYYFDATCEKYLNLYQTETVEIYVSAPDPVTGASGEPDRAVIHTFHGATVEITDPEAVEALCNWIGFKL